METNGASVEFAMDAPSASSYRLLGPVVGEAAATDPDVAQQAARNDIRNKAAAMGGVLVTIDETLGEPMFLQDKTKVKLVGRAYKPVD